MKAPTLLAVARHGGTDSSNPPPSSEESGATELLNRSGELGIAAPGARADLIVIDGDPLADISLLDGQGEHLTHIMKDGAFYKRLV